jgi:uncharacterized pyridoxal phosphate-containing UPF0001 family protein
LRNPTLHPRLKARGLMTLAISSADAERVRTCFPLLRSLRDRDVSIPCLTQLSMGMSGDYGMAIEEDANIVRILSTSQSPNLRKEQRTVA